jgi:hypothetical protein
VNAHGGKVALVEQLVELFAAANLRNMPWILFRTKLILMKTKIFTHKHSHTPKTNSYRFHENDHLIEIKSIKQLSQLSILVLLWCEVTRINEYKWTQESWKRNMKDLVELNIELLQTVQSKLLVFVDVDFMRILSEFLANHADILAECGRIHHHLLLMRSLLENLLHGATHI